MVSGMAGTISYAGFEHTAEKTARIKDRRRLSDFIVFSQKIRDSYKDRRDHLF